MKCWTVKRLLSNFKEFKHIHKKRLTSVYLATRAWFKWKNKLKKYGNTPRDIMFSCKNKIRH